MAHTADSRQGLCGTGGKTFAFLKQRRARGSVVTHTRLDNGKFEIHDCEMDEFRQCVAEDMCKGLLPALSEFHTVVFPFYADVDLEVKVPSLTDEAILEMARVMNCQIAKFYPEAIHDDITHCLVCTKSGEPEPGKAEGTYKTGVHLHWPKLLVDREQARQLLAGMNAGLGLCDKWPALLGTQVAWEDVLDASVYSTGLRVVGAPKARKCACSQADRNFCEACGGVGHLYNSRAYMLRTVVQGDVVDETALRKYRANPRRIVDYTSVRTKHSEVTPGFERYHLCPQPPHEKKRKGAAVHPTDKAVATVKRTTTHAVSSAAANAARELLNELAGVEFKDRFARCILDVRQHENGKELTVLFNGDGCHFCINQQREHGGNRNYMKIVNNQKSPAHAFLKCFSCKPSAVSDMSCKDFRSRAVKLSPQQRYALFQDKPVEKETAMQRVEREKAELDAQLRAAKQKVPNPPMRPV